MSGYRTQPLPAGWKRTRQRVLWEHSGVCHVCGLTGATEVDHVIPVSRGGTDAPHNLRPIHGYRDVLAGRARANCHGTKTAHESGRLPRRRDTERHPGSVGVG